MSYCHHHCRGQGRIVFVIRSIGRGTPDEGCGLGSRYGRSSQCGRGRLRAGNGVDSVITAGEGNVWWAATLPSGGAMGNNLQIPNNIQTNAKTLFTFLHASTKVHQVMIVVTRFNTKEMHYNLHLHLQWYPLEGMRCS